MGIRPKLFLIFFLCGIVPMLFLGVFNYWSGAQAIEALLRNDIQQDINDIADVADAALREREATLTELARADFIREAILGTKGVQTAATDGRPQSGTTLSSVNASAPAHTPASSEPPGNLRGRLTAFLLSHNKYFAAITCLDASRRIIFRAEESRNKDGVAEVRFQTENFLPDVAVPDERVWTATAREPLRSPVMQEPAGAILHYTIPVFGDEEDGPQPRGALLVDLKLDALYKDAASGRALLAAPLVHAAESTISPRVIVALDQNGQIIYHTNEALRHQTANQVIPYFKPVADEMLTGRSAWKFYWSPEGDRWLVAYRPSAPPGVSLAVAGDYTAAMRGPRRKGWLSLALAVLFGLIATVLLSQTAGRTARSIEQVTEGAVAIARGRRDRRIEVRSSDEMRALAESVNEMNEQLREQMRRESEAQQFQSFMRISAMLTHDLKNAISALSLLVDNMESKFDRAEFRADAMQSLKEATNKLKRLVSKLSNPVETLSGEYKLPRPTDLVPIIKGVLAALAEPVRRHHEIETELPPSLVASVDGDKIEKVIENLVLNALEAMGARGGRLTITAGPAGAREVFFSVADTGPGMTEEFIRTRLFRPFSTTKSKGVGLGLYTCREVVRAYGGRLEVESQRNIGTRFRVVLPLDQKITGPGGAGQPQIHSLDSAASSATR